MLKFIFIFLVMPETLAPIAVPVTLPGGEVVTDEQGEELTSKNSKIFCSHAVDLSITIVFVLHILHMNCFYTCYCQLFNYVCLCAVLMPQTLAPVVEVVTDENGEAVTDSQGQPVTSVVPTLAPVPVTVTLPGGDVVTDQDGEPIMVLMPQTLSPVPIVVTEPGQPVTDSSGNTVTGMMIRTI